MAHPIGGSNRCLVGYLGPMSLTRLEVQFPNRRALLASARSEGGSLSLFIPLSQDVAIGTRVMLDIKVEGTPLRFELEGNVRMQLSAPGSRQGLGITFTGTQKRPAAQMLASCAGRALEDGTALDTRHDVDVRCVVNLPGKRLKGALKDVSSTGAFIGAASPSAVRGHTELTIQLEPLFGLWGGSVLKARVIWVGEKRGVPGFGVRFLDATTQIRERLKKHFT